MVPQRTPDDVPQHRLAELIEVRRNADETVTLTIDGQALPYFTCPDEGIAVGVSEHVSTVGVVFLAQRVTVVDDVYGTTSSTDDLAAAQPEQAPGDQPS